MKRALFTSNCSSNYRVAEIIRCTWHCNCDACTSFSYSFFSYDPKEFLQTKKMKCNLNFSIFMLDVCMHCKSVFVFMQNNVKVSVLKITEDFANNVILSSLSIHCCFCCCYCCCWRCIHTSLRNCSYKLLRCGNRQVLLEYFKGETTLHRS